MSGATKGLIEQVKEALGGKAAEFQLESPSRLYVAVAREHAREAVEGLFRDLGARLITISSVDTRPGIELLYHLAFDRAGLVCTVRTIVPKPSPEIESITPAIPGAEWVEREIHELMGVNFLNHPNLAPLILADDWPEGSYPLRRSDG